MKNSLSISLALSVFSGLSFLVGPVAFALCTLPLAFVLLFGFKILPSGIYTGPATEKFFNFLRSDSKISRYIKFDAKNEPISYGIISIIWVVCLVYLVSDLVNFGSFGYDIVLMFFSVYLVSMVMVLYGYIKEYDKL